ncbi:Uma2 family endonuclease [Crocosphaera watsonii]|uniref:Uma2 family endonuclease n=1 Tax=Crocosphaera watsonii TaxID=263511 RepID=UPI002F419FA5
MEPDECYYISNEALIRDKIDFDFTIDPPPDLAIEIDITSSSLNRFTIYESLKVREIWRFNGQDVFIYCLKDGGYQEESYSQVLPILSKSVILTFLKKRGKIGENALIREFRQWLNNNK